MNLLRRCPAGLRKAACDAARPLTSRALHTEAPASQSGPTAEELASLADGQDTVAGRRSAHVYSQLFRWKSLTQFVDALEQRVVYNDGQLLALDKPWGVGTHLTNRRMHKLNAYEALSRVGQQPKFCLDDALPELGERLRLSGPLQVVKSIDRNLSGLVLLATDPTLSARLRKSVGESNTKLEPHLGFDLITSGHPAMGGQTELRERVAIQLQPMDQLGNHKEPIIIEPRLATGGQLRAYKVQTRLQLVERNTQLGVAHLRIFTNKTRWNFVRCYASSKCAFVLGDIRFASRVKQLLGQKVLVKPADAYRDLQFEPLSDYLRRRLRVQGNSSIPLMLHLAEMRLPRFRPDRSDLVIRTTRLPDHFQWTLDTLQLGAPAIEPPTNPE